MPDIKISVQEQNFDQNAIYQWLTEPHSVGAAVIFIGKVREMNLGNSVSGLYLEHYPAMTGKALQEIVVEAKNVGNFIELQLCIVSVC